MLQIGTEVRDGEGAVSSTRGACAPQSIRVDYAPASSTILFRHSWFTLPASAFRVKPGHRLLQSSRTAAERRSSWLSGKPVTAFTASKTATATRANMPTEPILSVKGRPPDNQNYADENKRK